MFCPCRLGEVGEVMANVLSDGLIGGAMEAVKHESHECPLYLELALARIERDRDFLQRCLRFLTCAESGLTWEEQEESEDTLVDDLRAAGVKE
jgi:hypothetical protein